MRITQRAVFFIFAGTIGFLVDCGVLYLIKNALGLYIGRLVSFLCAAITTWLLNRSITFSDRYSSHTTLRELLIYISIMTFGGAVNYSVYAVLISESLFAKTVPFIAVAVGSIAGMLVNLLSARFIIYRFSSN